MYGPPARGEYFMDRDNDLRYIFSRLLTQGQSTAVVGEPHVGKSSLLWRLQEPKIQQAYLGDAFKGMMATRLDLHGAGSEFKPAVFWEKAISPLRDRPGDAATAKLIDRVVQAGYSDRQNWEALFEHLYRKKRQFVLLLDEFESLLPQEAPLANFNDFSFFATLRALDAFPSFSFVTTSRVPVSELNKRGHRLSGSGGSPLFNTQVEWHLRPFDDQAIAALFKRAGKRLSTTDQLFVQRIAGRNPYLLQALGSFLLEAGIDDGHAKASERFYEAVAHHFDDLWNHLDDNCRTTAVILSLVELGGQALGDEFSYGEIERVDRFGPELRILQEHGLAELVEKKPRGSWLDWILDTKTLLIWRGERWTIGGQAFAWWVRDVVIAETRKIATYDEWLRKQKYSFVLTQGQWEYLVNKLRNAPAWAVHGVADLARSVLQEILRR
jgi:hypothetical protein